jgi:hypothetical protein
MTAANLIVRERAAYVVTDTAVYRPDGVLLEFASKVFTSPRLRIAITGCGVTWGSKKAVIDSWMGAMVDEDRAVEAMPALTMTLWADLKAELRSRGVTVDPNAWPPLNYFELIVAVWSERRQRAEGYAVASRGATFYPDIKVESGRVYQLAQRIQPPAELGDDPSLFDEDHAERDGLALLEEQRRYVDGGRYLVGGTAHLTTVSEAGVSRTVLREWPDEIGRRIDPSRDGAECPC